MKSWVLLSIFSLAYSAHADEPVTCDYGGNQQEMNACATQEFSQADLKLNTEYKRVLAALSDAKKETLRQEQRGWLKQRDSRCKAEANEEAEGGSMWPMIFNSCRAKITEARTNEILNLLK